MSGHTAADEMCNLYMMLYSQLPYFGWCLDNHTVVEVRLGLGTRWRQVGHQSKLVAGTDLGVCDGGIHYLLRGHPCLCVYAAACCSAVPAHAADVP